jgi:hypothetical protein
MFPAVIVLRGGGLPAPISFNHAGATFSGNLSRDTISILYSFLTVHAPKSAEAVRRRPFVEVAEFFGPEWALYANTPKPPTFETANHFSRIYLPAAGEPALWDSPVVASGSAALTFYELGPAALDALKERGVKLR